MSKLLLAIVHREDAEPVASALVAEGYRFTRVPTIGGFLGEANQTLVLAVEDDVVEDALSTIERSCQPREVEVPLVLVDRLQDWEARTVAHGGATVLIAELDRIVRL